MKNNFNHTLPSFYNKLNFVQHLWRRRRRRRRRRRKRRKLISLFNSNV